jgi:hypothetical protein
VLRRRVLSLFTAAIVAGACGGVSCALQGTNSVVIQTDVAADGSGGIFTLSGGCDLCQQGTVINVSVDVENGEFVFLDEFECADGTGSFELEAQLIGWPDGSERTARPGEWGVVSGTGDYASLWGHGDYQNRTSLT